MTKVLLNKVGNNKEEVLDLQVIHRLGSYVFTVSKKFIEYKDNCSITTIIPFASGNFNYKITKGRKSQKKLDLLNNIIEENKHTLLGLWTSAEYKAMCNLIQTHNQRVYK